MKGIDAFDRRYSLAGYLLLLVIFLPALVFIVLNTYQTVPTFFADSQALRDTGLSFARALAVTAIAAVLAFPGIIIYAKCKAKIRNLLRAILSFAFCFPTVLMNMCFDNIAYLQLTPVIRSAVMNLALNIPLLIAMVGEHWRRLDIRDEMCSRTIGTSRVRIFFTLTLPKILPALSGACALVMMRCMAYSGNLIVSILISVLFLIILVSSDQKRSMVEMPFSDSLETRKGYENGFAVILSFIYMVAVLCLVILPGLSMILSSVHIEGRISLEAYRLLFSSDRFLKGLAFCLALALASSVISSLLSVHICVGIANTGCSILLVMLPFAFGSFSLATGFTGLYPWTSDSQTVRMVFTLLCHVLILTPIQIMILLPTARALPRNLRKTAVSLGSTSAQGFRRIDLRIMDSDVRSAFFTSIAMSIGSYGAAKVFGLNTLLYQSLSLYQQGNAVSSSAIGSIILILCFIFFFMGIGHTREGKRNV